MAKRIFVTATNTDIGKTYTTKLVLKEFASRGLKVGVIKPIETGVIDGYCPDGDVLLGLAKELNPDFKNISIDDIVPIQHRLAAAPYIASNYSKLDLRKINKSIEKLEKLCDVLVFEGAGGLLVPIDEEYMIVDLIKIYKATAILVTHCSLGTINDTLLSKKLLDDLEIKNITVFNCRDEDTNFAQISEKYFTNIGLKVLKVNQDIDKICDLLYNQEII